jgi:hypothetical protein
MKDYCHALRLMAWGVVTGFSIAVLCAPHTTWWFS